MELTNSTNNNSNQNNTIILNELKILSSVFLDNIRKIDVKVDDVLTRIKKLENKVEFIETYQNQSDIKKIRELKFENMNISNPDAIKALNYRDYRSVLHIFKLYYKNKLNVKNMYPIRIKSTRSYEYYSNDEWIPDLYGKSIMNILCRNLEKLFIRINTIDHVGPDYILQNQEFIYKMSDDKFKSDVLNRIIEEIRFNCY